MKTLILFIDALAADEITKENSPFLYNLAEEGVFSPLKTIPAGYHIEYSMLSGCLPIKHNVWTWYYLKKNSSFSKIKYLKPLLWPIQKLKFEKLGRKIIDAYINIIRFLQGKTRFLKTNKIPLDLLQNFEIAVDKAYVDHNPLSVPTIFDIFRKENKNYVAMEYPVISNNKRTWFYFGSSDFRQLNRIEKLLKKYSIVFAHIWNLDSIKHKYGSHSKESVIHIKKLDAKIKKIVESQKEKLRIIIFSDHGGINVIKTRNILDIIKDYDVSYFLGSTNTQIWMKNPNEKTKEEIKNRLKKEGYLVYDETNIEKELKIPYKREFVGDILAWVKPTEQIYPDFFRDTMHVKSMHGYTISVPELYGAFIMHGFGIKKQVKEMNLYDIAPTILKAMKLKIPEVYDGKSAV